MSKMHHKGLQMCFSLVAILSLAGQLHGQASPTAVQQVQIGVFGAMSETFSLDGAKNLGVMAGADIGVRPRFGVLPALEFRATRPAGIQTLANVRSAMGGLKVSRRYSRYHPYADFLFGVGEIDFNPAFPSAHQEDYVYTKTASYVFSPGGGVDIDLTRRFALKADFQYQHLSTPVTPSGSIWIKPVSLGVNYTFDFNHHPKYGSMRLEGAPAAPK